MSRPPSPSSSPTDDQDTTSAGDANPTPWQTASDIVAWERRPGLTTKVVEVEGYFGRAKCVGAGGHMTSDAFHAGDYAYDWRVKIYPDGKTSSDSGWVSVYLQIQPVEAYAKDMIVMARFSFRLLGQDRQEVPSYSREWSKILPFAPEEERGYRRYIEVDALQPYLGDDDCFRVSCDVVVYDMYPEPAVAPRPVVVPPSDLHRQLLALLRSERGGDVTFAVGGELFPSHKYMVAARSPVFMAELFGPMMMMKAENSSVVRVDDMEPRVFEAMLEFIYTDSLPEIDDGETVEMAQHLLVVVDRYDLQRLKLICEDILCDNIKTSTAATTITLAEQHGCRGLKEACMYHIASPGNLEAVMASDSFPHLTKSYPALHRAIVRQATAVSGSHVVKIVGYSHTKTLGCGNCLTSKVFVVGGRRWCMEYYLDGHGPEHADWISVFIRLDRSDPILGTTAKARYEISLLALDGNPVASCRIASKARRKFSGRRKHSGALVEKKVLEESGYLNDDAFRIRCDITMAK